MSQLLDSCLAEAADPETSGWDQAAQRALAAVALDRALKDLGRPEDTESQAALREMLRAIKEPKLPGEAQGVTGRDRFDAALGRFRARLNQ